MPSLLQGIELLSRSSRESPQQRCWKTIVVLIVIVLFAVLSGCKEAPTGTPLVRQQWAVFNTSNSKLANNHINAFYLDAEGKMWVGTGSGVSCFRQGSWSNFAGDFSWTVNTPEGSRSVSVVTSIAESPDRTSMWFALAGGGVARYNINASTVVWKRYTTDDGLPFNYVLSIAAERLRGDIWCTTMYGLARFIPAANESGTWLSYTTDNSQLPSNSFRCVMCDPVDNSVWFGSQFSEIAYMDGEGKWQRTITLPYPYDYPISAITFDLTSIWFAKWQGVSSFNTQTLEWRHYSSDNTNGGLPYGMVYAVATNLETTRWFGTNKGLVRLSGDTWTTFNRNNSPQLPSDTVTAVIYDMNGNLWIGTVNGLALFNEQGIKY